MISKDLKKVGDENALFKAIIRKLQEHGGNISFAELTQIPGFSGAELLWTTDGKIYSVLWVGLSTAARNVIIALDQMEIIQMDRTSVATYIHDGMILPLPLTDNQSTVMWIPVVLNKGERWGN